MAIQVQGTTIIDDSRKLVNFRYTTNEISSNTTATAGQFYIATANVTLTLPSSPTVGDVVGFQNSANSKVCIIARNSANIMAIAEDLIINKYNVPITLQYVSTSRGWVFV